MSDLEQIRVLLKKALPAKEPELRHDLWPAMLRRMDERSETVPWYDWLLALAGAALILGLPRLLPVLLYNL